MSHVHNMVAKRTEGSPGYLYMVCEGPAADAEDPYQHGCQLDTRINVGAEVRVVNWAGPCLNRYQVVSVGKSRYKLKRGYGTRGLESYDFKHFIEVHIDPCTRCTDHPQTMYPNGYTN